MSELPVVLPHVEASTVNDEASLVRTVFATGAREDRTVFREEITIALKADHGLEYSHAWGLPGEDFGPRSSCRLQASGA
jgi:hypothetical protein